MIRQKISDSVEKAIRELQGRKSMPEFTVPQVLVEHPEEPDYGDYSVNIAFRIAKQVGKRPGEIAEEIKKMLEPLPEIQKVIAMPSGFLNFFLSPEFLKNEITLILKKKEKYGSQRFKFKPTTVIDYSAPNIAKPFGIGHLRSTIIGQAIYNIYKFIGWKCIGDNHLGDWGTQFGKLVYQIKMKKLANKKAKEVNEILKSLTINELEGLYVEFHREAAVHSEMENEAREFFKKLEAGDKEVKKIWRACVKVSLTEFDRIYKLLGVKIDHTLGESFYKDKPMKEIVNELSKKKITTKSQGAVVIEYKNNEMPPAMVLKSDGTTTYFLRDLATAKYRIKRWKPDILIYEVGADQILHLKQLFSTIKDLNWVKKERFVHVAHGLVRWSAGKFSTRKGQTVHLEEVLTEAIARAQKIIESSKTSTEITKTEAGKIAEIVGIGAVKYNDLSQHYSKDIIFDWRKILNLEGNSGPYLQYTAVRCRSVLKKAGIEELEKISLEGVELGEEEKNILRSIYKFSETVQNAADNFSPNLICNFAFDLAQKYNVFYTHCPILAAGNQEVKNIRLALTAATEQVLKNSLNLLGISIPEKM
ncbi:MAG: arginine--tRNA ligase [bacterium]